MDQTYHAVRDSVVNMLSRFPDGTLSLAAINNQIDLAIDYVRLSSGAEFDGAMRADLVKELETRFSVWIGTAKILEDDTGHVRWLEERRGEIDWDFWERYRELIMRDWATPKTVASLEKLTDDILRRLEDPLRPGEWDRRGLVVGHVQSGKTANYAGLICKAADAGYRVIVVLAGMHNNLRSQTQVRLEEGFLGYSSLAGEAKRPVGVGLINSSLVADTITDRTDRGDFNKAVAKHFNIAPGQRPLLFVVKKNASTLKNLLKWVRGYASAHEMETGRSFVADVPILVIDDEADQASVNSKPEGLEPTRINGLVRELLFTFAQSAYVGYTATPFANIFIHDQSRSDQQGQDLFPRSFIISLPAPSNYVGPARVFGLNGDDDAGIEGTDAMPLVRSADDGRLWIPDRHKKDLRPNYSAEEPLPPSLHEAMLAFVLAGAAKMARGLGGRHHSMLIHVTRFVAVQNEVARQVGEHLELLRERVVYGDGDSPIRLLDELEDLWRRDFAVTTGRVAELLNASDGELTAVSWDEVRPHIRPLLDALQVHIVNGSSADALAYEDHKAEGLKVIAVGGNKLSRGLTLEDLSTSYFLRSSKMYDTLMQMGRWFGYRPGYVDLCRLYLPEDIEEWFEHITEASEELRREFDYMTITGGTPKDYGLRVRSHPTLMITSQVKMRAGMPLRLSFAGETSETVVFPNTAQVLEDNYEATVELVESLGAPVQGTKGPVATTGRLVWTNVGPQEVTGFLRRFNTHAAAWRVNRELLAEFIDKQVAKGDLVDWTVCLVSNEQAVHTHRFGDYVVGLTSRATASSGPHPDRLSVRRLVSPTDEAIDLTEPQYAAALALTIQQLTDSTETPKRPSGRSIRDVRASERGLLLVYPLDPAKVGRDESMADLGFPVVGFAISFPKIENAETVDYKVNHVYWEQFYGANDWDDEEGEDES